jgi:uncharacterized membrane protein YphA (DoxX/SURF4 family)
MLLFSPDPSHEDIKDFMDDAERAFWDNQRGTPEERAELWKYLEELWRSIPDPTEGQLQPPYVRYEDWQGIREHGDRGGVLTFYRRQWKKQRKADAIARWAEEEAKPSEPPTIPEAEDSEKPTPKANAYDLFNAMANSAFAKAVHEFFTPRDDQREDSPVEPSVPIEPDKDIPLLVEDNMLKPKDIELPLADDLPAMEEAVIPPTTPLKPKPLDAWLFIGGLVAGIVLYLLPKTPALVVGLLILCFALLIHPVWNFWWIEQRSWRRVVSIVLLAVFLIFVGYLSWPVSASVPQLVIASPTPTPTVVVPSPLPGLSSSSGISAQTFPAIKGIPVKGGKQQTLDSLMSAAGYRGSTVMLSLEVVTERDTQISARIPEEPAVTAVVPTRINHKFKTAVDTKDVFIFSDKDTEIDVMYLAKK